jgi:NADPH-dependent ferric siderophore reductase
VKTDYASRRVQRVRHELRRRDVAVLRVEALSPNFTRITFGDDALADFVSLSFDDHVKFMFEDDRGAVVRRDYTPRAFDPRARTMTIEFALHVHGAASDWARQAAPGQRVTIGGPRGSMIIPMDYDWHLLAGDATALPAMHRRIEELPGDARALAVVRIEDPADARAMRGPSGLEVHWVYSGVDLIAAVRDLQWPEGEGFAWGAGEACTMRQLRDVLLHERALPREQTRVAAYWKYGSSEYHETLDA